MWIFKRLPTQHLCGRTRCGGNPDGESQPLRGICEGLRDTEWEADRFLEWTIGALPDVQDKLTLMIPGPTPVPETVLKAMGRHPIGHRSGEFQAVVERTTAQLRWLHQTNNDVLVITGSGTAAMEAGIINTLSRGDRVICGDNGKFGERWVKVARAYGLEVDVIKAD